MEKELIRECGQRHMMFWREGPKFFNVMKEKITARRKKAQALRIAARYLLVKTYDAWRHTSKRIKEERVVRRREREMERKVSAQRSQALVWARTTVSVIILLNEYVFFLFTFLFSHFSHLS